MALAKNKSQTDKVSTEKERLIDNHKKMKRYGHLFENIVKIENIEKAIDKASLHKKKRKSVTRVLNNKRHYAEIVQQLLLNGKYYPSPYLVSTIYDGARHKERTIYKPRFFPDQIIHWAVMLQIGDILLKRFYPYSCASIKGRGTKTAFKQTEKALKGNSKYCLKLDIRKFYPSVDKEILKAKFRRVFKDEDLLRLLDIIVDGNRTQGDGLPIGNYSSQWFANFYLTDLDCFIKEKLKVKYYIRYMDDMVIFHSNKRKLRKIKEEIETFLKSEKLEIKDNWQIFPIDKRFLGFLGYRFYRNHITLRRNNFLRIKRRAKKVYRKGYISYTDACAMISYDGLIKKSNCHTYLMKYIYPYVSVNRCRKVVSNENRKQHPSNKKI